MIKKCLINSKGFTLAEIMVGVAIIAILSTVSFASFTSYRRQGIASSAAQKLTSDFRKIQGYSLGLKKFYNGSEFVLSKGGWGMYMRSQPVSDNKNYIVFADYDGPGGVPNGIYSNSEFFFNYTFEGVHISDIRLEQNDHSFVNRNQVNITFEPPVPTVHICANNASDCDYLSTEIELTSDTSGATSHVIINKVGLVDTN